MDRPRGRPTGGRARGKAQDGQQQQQQQSRGPPQQQSAWGPPQQQRGPPQQQAWGPPLQQSSQAAPPPQQSAWTARGRGNGPPQPQQQQQQQRAPQQRPVQDVTEQATQQMQSLSVRGGGEASGSVSRGKAEPTRGTVRQRAIDETHVFRNLDVKQGTKGDRVNLQANYFQFMEKANMVLIQYRVDFNPDIEATFVRKAILSRFKEDLGKYIFDGTVMYSMTRLKEGYEVTTKNTRDDSLMRIIIKQTTDLHPGDPHYVMFMNQIMRTCLAKMNLQLVNRDYYDANLRIELPQHKLEIWPGYGTSIRQHETAILLNCDLTSKVMRHETALDVLMQCREKARDVGAIRALFEEVMINSIVLTRYNNKNYKVDDVDWESTPNSTFDKKGQEVTYKEYFRQKYQLNIKYDDQPILVSNPKDKDIRGGRSKLIGLIPELSCVCGITDSMRADFTLMKALAEHTRVTPRTRIQRLEQGFMERLSTTTACQEELKLWNMSFDPKLITFPGRILPAENVQFGQNMLLPVDSKTGDFTKIMLSKRARLLDTGTLTNWAVIYPRKINHGDVVKFCQTLARAASTIGINIPEPRFEALNDDKASSYVNAIEMVCSTSNAMLIMTLVPNNRADRYSAIKKKCYVQRPVPNQVVLAKNVTKNNMSVCTKIAIQLSCKIGGSPWSVPIPFKGHTMIVGFDVCHDTSMRQTSVGALVASLNSTYSRYYSSVTFHKEGTELCDSLPAEMLKALITYRAHNNGELPSRIFFYRDGVGEGNLHYTLEHEVKKIVEMWNMNFPERGECPLTFIVVSKRINTRIFYQANNPPPGTVVDSTITLPNMYDFFLVSQSVNQGTVSPTSYNVIYDKQNIRPDVIQQLSYKLTHMYFNWSGTVRVPAPCQYAHKLAFLVGQHIHTLPTGMTDILYYL
uniref:Protein piwi n=1 Tax=Lygus hesperus TaxID=30085 RepID=A0A0A9YSH4_LYGHE